MALKVYKCNNDRCLTALETQFTDEDHTCSDCGEMMVVDNVASMRGISIDRVPGGYDSEVFKQQRNSRDGMLAEANYLSGESDSAY